MPRHIALLAGSGRMVEIVQEAAERQGDTVSVFGLGPFAHLQGDEAGGNRDHSQEDQVGGFLDELEGRLRASGASHLLAIGGVRLSARDRRTANTWLKNGDGEELGDDNGPAILETLAGRAGLELLSAAELVPEALATAGLMAGKFQPAHSGQYRKALVAARAAGGLDLGQAVVCSGGRPIAVEGVEGTDGLIARVGGYVKQGIAGGDGSLLILAKALRPGQPHYFDMPAVGPNTVSGCANAFIDVIVLEAGGGLMIDRLEMLELADRLGVGVVGLTPE
ncbi:MAG: LpxI family protein [Alphaproteobacteria bacterium]|nr:LpxI family protein [Alphaproteobacteria bacterium]